MGSLVDHLAAVGGRGGAPQPAGSKRMSHGATTALARVRQPQKNRTELQATIEEAQIVVDFGSLAGIH